MKPRILTVFSAATLVFAAFQPAVSHAQAAPAALPGPCVPGTLPSHALSLVCVPRAGWNGALVVFAPGYASPFPPEDPKVRNLTLPDGTDLPTLVQSIGFAFATTSYRQNGLAILEGVDDMRELVSAFSVFPGVPPGFPLKTYVAGVSEGGLVATLLAERSPDLFASALATCGPVGSFQAQVDYFGDFRVLFDYFFPGVLPGSAVNVPVPLMENWYTLYAPAVAAALTATPEARARAVELLRVAKAPFDPAHPETVLQTVLGVIWYNVFATNDAIAKLGGNPYGNRFRWYFGSSNDFRLNLMVRRFSESPVAREALRKYETSGQL